MNLARVSPRLVPATMLALATPFALCRPAWTQDFDQAEIRTETLADGLHVLITSGGGVIAGNMAVLTGEHGVLLIDDQMAELAPRYKATIRELAGRDGIDFAINTHWHFDHSDGNRALGPEGTRLVSQALSRQMMLRDNVINLGGNTIEQPAYPSSAVPAISFDRRMRFHFNGEVIDLLHVGPAHTTGDAAVIFQSRNAVHLGDVFNNSGYPFIDADNGGSLSGLIEFCRAVLDRIDRDTIVIPGHGPTSDYQGLADYIERLTTIRDRIQSLIDDGASLEQVVAAEPTAEFNALFGSPGQPANPASFIDRSYTSLTPR